MNVKQIKKEMGLAGYISALFNIIAELICGWRQGLFRTYQVRSVESCMIMFNLSGIANEEQLISNPTYASS